MTITIREHRPGEDVADFVRAGHVVFEGDPAWVPPLDFEIKERLSPKKNPLFNRAEVVLFTAWNGTRLVGRCSATIDREHLRVWKDDTGFFGFFDTVDDVEVGRKLVEAAATWLKARGMKRMMGPFSLYANEEVGVLIEGHEMPPMLSMGHSRAYQAGICDAVGLEKEKDLLCFRWDSSLEFSKRALKAWEDTKALPEVKLRSVDPSRMTEELKVILDIYNDAWEGKWGMVPALPDEVAKIAQDMKLVLDPDIAFIAEVNGKPAGMCIMVPNLNEAIYDLGGSLFPTGAFKLLWRTKVKHPLTARLIMLGINRDVRANIKRYGGLSTAMYVEVAKRGVAKGYNWAELSWIREDDAPVSLGIKMMGGQVYKKYRVYKKSLES